TAAEQMLRVEAAQIAARSGELQNILADAGIDPDRPAGDTPAAVRKQFLEAMLDHPSTPNALKQKLGAHARAERPAVPVGPGAGPTPSETPQIPPPVTRRLRVFAFDPVLGLRVDTESINETTLEVPW